MSKFKKNLFSLFVVPLMVTPQLLQPKIENIEPQSQVALTPVETIKKYSQEYNIDENLLYSIIKCESGFNQNAVGLHGEVTMAQFLPSTFYGQAKKMGEQLDIKSYHDTIKLTAYSLANGDGKLWTTYVAIKNGGKYTFTDKKGTVYTARCNYQIIS